ncbi:hypothetical protein J6590_064404 [Homalodisca vitripennis]|nr:hypothetical protein J6590_100714 [Homalodisca vitripennis]KAG8315775.1 hypothetical protein J6590_064404 [Homalodisca vitripennis]
MKCSWHKLSIAQSGSPLNKIQRSVSPWNRRLIRLEVNYSSGANLKASLVIQSVGLGVVGLRRSNRRSVNAKVEWQRRTC